MTYRNSTALISVLAMACAAPAFAGDMKADKATFNKFDTNANAEIDFTEFYNHVSQYGYSDVDAAQEFTRLAGSEDVITSEGFAGFDASKLMAKQSGSMESTYQTTDTSYDSGAVTTYRNDQMVVLGTTSVSGDFKSYDRNNDGMVNYDEYAKVAKKNGISKTAAAREFIQISGGQTQFDENAFNTAQYSSATYQTDQGQSQGYTNQTTTNYEVGTTSGAYTAPSTTTDTMVNSQDKILNDVEASGNPQMKVWDNKSDSGAYMNSDTEVTVDPTVGVEVETDNPVEEAWEDTKDATSDVWEDTKDVTSDAWDATKDAASDTADEAEDLVDPDQ